MLRLHAPDRTTEPLTAEVVAGGGTPILTLPSAQEIQAAVWVDLAFPLEVERRLVEEALGLELPDKSDMTEIEASSRVYREGTAHVMNVLMVVGVDSGEPAAVPVSLILLPGKLVTVRYSDPRAFRSLDQSCGRLAPGANAVHLLTRLLDNVVDRTADILERMGGEIDSLSNLVFGLDRPKSLRMSNTDLQTILRRIGSTQFVLNKVHDSLVTLLRAHSFLSLGQEAGETRVKPDKHVRESLKSLNRDIMSLLENSAHLSQNVSFLLDAALGRISIEQNAIVKIFSVAAVIFLPPTLVASIYGMNFVHMPELEWVEGYPMALALMVMSAVLPYLYFKRRGWL
ncbi:magnesium transporter CorA family protein [Sandaracinobacteroides hominis]|uniref:magnesium transporter CorA family protein n=1 Tax=Sandaracinobacteroides hominis TaxID=2780086 RepID=UPI0018F5FAD5|nr:magnesium transporter CorA family protein [Sandaracinobacteroides hominis]